VHARSQRPQLEKHNYFQRRFACTRGRFFCARKTLSATRTSRGVVSLSGSRGQTQTLGLSPRTMNAAVRSVMERAHQAALYTASILSGRGRSRRPSVILVAHFIYDIILFTKQDTQYKNNVKQTYNITLSHRKLEDKPLIILE